LPVVAAAVVVHFTVAAVEVPADYCKDLFLWYRVLPLP
jgi:hypothetical protein